MRAWETTARAQYRGPGLAAALRSLILATICPVPVNVLWLGPPGVAKTALVRAWSRACGLSALMRCLSPYTREDELLGAVDVAALASGVVSRVIDPARPSLLTAEIVLADELSRSVSGTRALMLSALSDRVTPTYDPVPAHVIVAAANSRLTSEEDRALVDRFLFRVEVPRLTAADDVHAVIWRRCSVAGAAPTAAPLAPLAPSTITALRAAAAAVDVPAPVAAAVDSLVLALRQPPPSGGAAYPDVSERRWELISQALLASAALDGRTAVDWPDLAAVIPMAIDDGPESRPAIRAAVDAAVPAWVRALSDLESACTAAVERARRVGGGGTAPGVEPLRPGDADAHATLDRDLDALVAALKPHGAAVLARAEARAERCRDDALDAYTTAQADARAARKASK